MKRILAVGAIVLVIVIALVVWRVLSNLDTLVASVIEQQGSRLTGTAVEVDGVEISLRDGRGAIRGLRVANPEGFSRRDAFALGEIVLQLDLASITQPPYRLEEVTIRAPEALYELDARARSNLQAILDRVKARSAGAEPEPEPAGEPSELRIDRFHFADGVVVVDAEARGVASQRLKLPPLTRQKLAGRPAEIGGQLLEAYLQSVIRTAAQSPLKKQLDGALEKGSAEAGKAVQGLLDKLGR